MAVNEELLDRQIRHSTYLERLKGQTVNKLIAQLERADDDLLEQLRRRGERIAERGFDTGPDTTRRLESLLSSLRQVQTDAYASLDEGLRDELQDFVKYEAEWQTTLLQDSIAVDLGIGRPDARSLFKTVTARPFQGRLLKEWMDGLEETAARRVRDAVRIGMVEGETIDQISRRIRGTQAQNYADGVLQMNRRNADAVVRTAVNHTANVAREATFEDNADILKGIQYVATLDSRTTLRCASLDGEIFAVGQGPRPPQHVNCRSVTTPVTKSYRELGIDLDEAPPGTRASMNGQVPDKVTYNEWLRQQSTEIQDDVLGKKKARLFRKGDVNIDRFTSRRGDELTLDQLRQREPTAWDRAGL